MDTKLDTSNPKWNPFNIIDKDGNPNWRSIKGVLIATVALLILLTLNSMYLYTPRSTPLTPTPTLVPALVIIDKPIPSNWKIYTDTTLHVTIHYPPSWKVQTSTQAAQNTKIIEFLDPTYTVPSCIGDCPSFSISLRGHDQIAGQDLNQTIEEDYKNLTLSKKDRSPLTIQSGQTGHALSFLKVMGLPNGSFFSVYTLQKDTVYTLSPSGGSNGIPTQVDDPEIKKRLEVFDQMLSSLEINTTPSNTVPTMSSTPQL